MLHWGLASTDPYRPKPRVCAVSYLNSVPLVWGALNGPQHGAFDLSFAIPSICAGRVAGGEADVGLVPVFEVGRLGFDYLPSVGIACHGPVRSILLVSKVAFGKVKTLAVDLGSRTSVQLARIVLQREHGVDPLLIPARPDLPGMLARADAALLIGDAALSVEVSELSYEFMDLGEEWVELTGLPMVFAVWAGHPGSLTRSLEEQLEGSCLYGLADLDRIIEEESERRAFPEYLVHQYLTRHIVFRLGPDDIRGMEEFLRRSSLLSPQRVLNVEKAYDEAAGSR